MELLYPGLQVFTPQQLNNDPDTPVCGSCASRQGLRDLPTGITVALESSSRPIGEEVVRDFKVFADSYEIEPDVFLNTRCTVEPKNDDAFNETGSSSLSVGRAPTNVIVKTLYVSNFVNICGATCGEVGPSPYVHVLITPEDDNWNPSTHGVFGSKTATAILRKGSPNFERMVEEQLNSAWKALREEKYLLFLTSADEYYCSSAYPKGQLSMVEKHILEPLGWMDNIVWWSKKFTNRNHDAPPPYLQSFLVKVQ